MKENQTINIKLLAVSDTKTKLIGLFLLKFTVKDFTQITKQSFSFDKSIDKDAKITISAQL